MTDCVPKYEPLPEWTQEEMEEVVRRGDPREVALVPLVAGLSPPDCDWAQSICRQLAQYPDSSVRGNAIIGFGYLAMTCRKLQEDIARPMIEAGMQDEDEWVRVQSEDAAEMCTNYLNWKFPCKNIE
jgi:hypothetical protein